MPFEHLTEKSSFVVADRRTHPLYRCIALFEHLPHGSNTDHLQVGTGKMASVHRLRYGCDVALQTTSVLTLPGSCRGPFSNLSTYISAANTDTMVVLVWTGSSGRFAESRVVS